MNDPKNSPDNFILLFKIIDLDRVKIDPLGEYTFMVI